MSEVEFWKTSPRELAALIAVHLEMYRVTGSAKAGRQHFIDEIGL